MKTYCQRIIGPKLPSVAVPYDTVGEATTLCAHPYIKQGIHRLAPIAPRSAPETSRLFVVADDQAALVACIPKDLHAQQIRVEVARSPSPAIDSASDRTHS
jgi:hypothetical protein